MVDTYLKWVNSYGKRQQFLNLIRDLQKQMQDFIYSSSKNHQNLRVLKSLPDRSGQRSLAHQDNEAVSRSARSDH